MPPLYNPGHGLWRLPAGLILSLLIGASTQGCAQTDPSAAGLFHPYKQEHICLLTGFHYNRYSYADIGLAYNYFNMVRGEPRSAALFAGTEWKPDAPLIWGPKLGWWYAGTGALCFGNDLIYYTNGRQARWCWRPQVGFGVHRYKLVYGYNIVLAGRNPLPINRHCFSLVLLWNFKRIKGNPY